MELMKNGLGQPAILRIAKAFKAISSEFDSKAFTKDCLLPLDKLELKERVEHIINVMATYLPKDFELTAQLLQSLKPVWDHGDKDDPLRTFAAWPVTDFVAKHGIEHPELAMSTLKYLTSLFSAEFAIRPFILRYPDLCHQYFKTWVNDQDEHVRRLVSEGTRPRLPWGIRLKPFIELPEKNIPLLASLKKDESLYVRRSVANHLNDIAKDHPDLVATTCLDWKDDNCKDTAWLIKHATRTLVKQGHPKALTLLGFTENPKIDVTDLTLNNTTIDWQQEVIFSCKITSTAQKAQKLVIDYIIDFVKANREQKAKVFKLKNVSLDKGESLTINKSFSFRPISTRKYYPGEHKLSIVINGSVKAETNFFLLAK